MAALLAVRVSPRAGADSIPGWRDGVLEARVTAPPEGGKANDALCRLLARALKVPAGSVRIASGHRARIKRVSVEGLGRDEVMRRLGAP
jgi:uncharacterized protein (TIGR00251 family)